MLNKAKIVSFDLWDADTGEATVIAQFEGGKTLKCFSLDQFNEDEFYEVKLSLFCNNLEITENPVELNVNNIEDDFRIDIQGLIVDFNSGDEYGDIITVDAGNIYFDVYLSFEDIQKHNPEMGIYFKGTGRLDIELPFEY